MADNPPLLPSNSIALAKISHGMELNAWEISSLSVKLFMIIFSLSTSILLSRSFNVNSRDRLFGVSLVREWKRFNVWLKCKVLSMLELSERDLIIGFHPLLDTSARVNVRVSKLVLPLRARAKLLMI